MDLHLRLLAIALAVSMQTRKGELNRNISALSSSKLYESPSSFSFKKFAVNIAWLLPVGLDS